MTAHNAPPLPRAAPRLAVAVLVAALAGFATLQALRGPPVARASALPPPPPVAVLRVAALGDPIPLAQLATLYLQAFDHQPGISIPFRELDYGRVTAWLEAALALDPASHYPLLLAAQVYSQVPDPARQEAMLEFVARQFAADPERRWRWLAHAAIVARHRLGNIPLALRYAAALQNVRSAPSWARQMHVLLLADMGEREAAQVLLGGLLASGAVTDPRETRFLLERLENTDAPKNRHP